MIYFLCLAKKSVWQLAVLIKPIIGAVPTDLFVKAEKVEYVENELEFGLPYNKLSNTLKYTLKFHYKFYNLYRYHFCFSINKYIYIL